MARVETWLRAVDIGGNDAVEVAPADNNTHCDAAFVDAFDVVGGPDYGVGDAVEVVVNRASSVEGMDGHA